MEKEKCHLDTLFIILVLFCIVVIGCHSNTGILAANNLSNKVTLSWDEVPGANSYNVYFSTRSNMTKLNSTKIENAANPLTIVDLEPLITYYLAVAVVDDFGEGRKSKEIPYRVAESKGFIKIENLLAPRDQIIFFDINSTKIPESEIAKLDRFAKYILEFNKYRVDLNGYTDSSGDSEDNRLISKYRADAVKSYLVRKGVKSETMDTVGYGASNFISDNSSADGRKMNRRVEIKFYITL